nr:HipA domain-containing protein [Aquicella siphonis]
MAEPDSAHYGLHPKCFTGWFGAPSSAQFLSLQRRSSTSSQEPDLAPQNASFFHGKFKKYSADLNGESYILKLRQDEAPELPEVEYLCNQIAKLLGIPVAEFYFISFNNDPAFVTKNFIKKDTPTDLQHIYHHRPDDQHSCEGIIRAVAEKTGRPHDISILIKTVLFDALIGNHDRHGRNLAFILTAKSMLLSPIYDNVSYLSLESGNMLKADFNPTGKISTSETFEPSMRDYAKELKRLGYADEINEFYQNIKLSRLYQLIDESFCSDLMKNAIKTLIEKRYKELQNESSN